MTDSEKIQALRDAYDNYYIDRIDREEKEDNDEECY